MLPTVAVLSIALLLSTVTRNSAASVVGTLMISLIMQLLGVISVLDFLHPYLLCTQFNAWQGPRSCDPGDGRRGRLGHHRAL